MSQLQNSLFVSSMIESGKRLASLFCEIEEGFSFSGKTTKELDLFIHVLQEKLEVVSACHGYKGFPGYSCISVNDVLVHAVPSDNVVMKDEDLVKVDICISYKGYCADMTRMFVVGNIAPNKIYSNMIKCANEALIAAFDECYVGSSIGSIGSVIKNKIVKYGFSVVRSFTGHGIGENIHEEPSVPNWGKPGKGVKIKSGMGLAIEPMFCQFSSELIIDKDDGWTARTKDGGIAAHMEDTVVIGRDGAIITTRPDL
jgi:methionyl aminopeptidase